MTATDEFCQTAESAFAKAWFETLAHYRLRRINSEACLQAALYAGLLTNLSEDFRIFVNASILLPDGKRNYIDLLICHDRQVVAAIELKYKPKAEISKIKMYPDIDKLLNLRNYRSKDSRIQVHIQRYLGSSRTDKEEFAFASDRRLIFAGYCRAEAKPLNTSEFWQVHKLPLLAHARSRRTIPPKLMVCLARTSKDLQAVTELYGGSKIMSSFPAVQNDA